jgi:hypothetical protein
MAAMKKATFVDFMMENEYRIFPLNDLLKNKCDIILLPNIIKIEFILKINSNIQVNKL